MSRWKVAQHVQYRFWLAYPASYDSEQPESNVDDDLPRQPLARGFRKWQDALDYADRMARTREVVLPRPDSTWFERPVWELGDGVTVHQSIADQSQTITADYPRLAIPNNKRRELALALLALAEQEEHA